MEQYIESRKFKNTDKQVWLRNYIRSPFIILDDPIKQKINFIQCFCISGRDILFVNSIFTKWVNTAENQFVSIYNATDIAFYFSNNGCCEDITANSRVTKMYPHPNIYLLSI